MILGEPTVDAIIEYLDEEGCPYCGETTSEIQVDRPYDIQLPCGHGVKAEKWIDSGSEFFFSRDG